MNHINQFCKINKLTIKQFYGVDTIYHSNFIDNSFLIKGDIPNGFRPVINHSLYIGNTILPNNFSPIVNGNLHLDHIESVNNFYPTVANNLYMKNLLQFDNFIPIVGNQLHITNVTKLPNNFIHYIGDYINYYIHKTQSNNNIVKVLNNYVKIKNHFGLILDYKESKFNYFKIKLINNNIIYIAVHNDTIGIAQYLPDAIINLKNNLNKL